jgi:hypothetical protein
MKNKENECNPQCNPLHSKVTLLPDEVLAKSWQIIDRLQPSEIYELSKIPNNRRALFIRCIKQRIDTLNDCEFNGDYTKIRKLSNNCIFVN